jgi:hypothetical protein
MATDFLQFYGRKLCHVFLRVACNQLRHDLLLNENVNAWPLFHLHGGILAAVTALGFNARLLEVDGKKVAATS